MTDLQLLAKKLAFIETCVQDLRDMAEPARIEIDLREQRFVAHTLQIAIQAALDVASHIVSDLRLGEPATNRDLFALLVKADCLPRELAQDIGNMAGFRNILVHGYQDVDPAIMTDVVVNHLDDLLAFVHAIRQFLPGSSETVRPLS